jgi:heme exporter protein A
MLQAVGLECVRGRRRLFRDLSFEAQPGELIWVAGPNGSGKTSLLRILCTLLPPDAGTVLWRGGSTRELGESFRAELAYLGHAAAVKDDLSALENLRFGLAQHGTHAEAPALVDALAAFGLQGTEELPARALHRVCAAASGAGEAGVRRRADPVDPRRAAECAGRGGRRAGA